MPDGDDLEQRARARVGRVLDEKYSLERLLGYGGMAAVYAARHRNGHRAAVKILHPEIARDEEVRIRFLQEGYAANKVEHPGAVTVMDDDVVRDGEDRGTAYLVMELLDGESVYSRVKRSGTLGEADVLAIAEGVLDVLDAAHTRGIVHRDLKPDNLFMIRPPNEDRERVKVLDFGIARIADTARRTNVGQTLGTPSYMAPEQARGQRDLVDGRSDLFSLGATMFRLLTGKRIHDGEGSTEILAKMATLPAPPMRSIAPNVSPALAAIIDRALQFDRDARYATAAEMRADVRAARAGVALPSADFAPIGFSPGAEPTGFATIAAKPPPAAPEPPTIPGIPGTVSGSQPLPPTVSNHLPAAVPAPIVMAMPMAAPPRAPSKLPLLIVAFATVAMVVIGGALFFVFSGSASPDPTREGPTAEEEHDEAVEKKTPKPVADKSADPRPVPNPDDPEPSAAPKVTAKPIAKPAPKATTKPTTSTSTKPAVPKMAPIPIVPPSSSAKPK